MKICLLSVDFLPNVGGIASHVYELSKQYVKNGHEVHIITYKDKSCNTDYEKIDGINVHRIGYPKIKGSRFLYAIKLYFKIKSLENKEKFDLVHSQTIIPDSLVYLLFNHKNRFITEHSSDFLNWMNNPKNYSKLFFILNKAKKVFGPSEEIVNCFLKLGVTKNKAVFIPNGVDIKKFDYTIKRDESLIKKHCLVGQKVILVPRRLEPKNGVIYAIRAIPEIIKRVENVKCIIVGGGWEEEKEKMLKEINNTGITDKVIFTGNVPNSEMVKYYGIADVVLLPSLQEATSIAGLEAMSMGKVLIGTKVGGLPYIIKDGKTGFLVEPRSPKSIAEKVLYLFNNKNLARKMGLFARKEVEKNFSWPKIAEKFLKEYAEVLS